MEIQSREKLLEHQKFSTTIYVLRCLSPITPHVWTSKRVKQTDYIWLTVQSGRKSRCLCKQHISPSIYCAIVRTDSIVCLSYKPVCSVSERVCMQRAGHPVMQSSSALHGAAIGTRSELPVEGLSCL